MNIISTTIIRASTNFISRKGRWERTVRNVRSRSTFWTMLRKLYRLVDNMPSMLLMTQSDAYICFGHEHQRAVQERRIKEIFEEMRNDEVMTCAVIVMDYESITNPWDLWTMGEDEGWFVMVMVLVVKFGKSGEEIFSSNFTGISPALSIKRPAAMWHTALLSLCKKWPTCNELSNTMANCSASSETLLVAYMDNHAQLMRDNRSWSPLWGGSLRRGKHGCSHCGCSPVLWLTVKFLTTIWPMGTLLWQRQWNHISTIEKGLNQYRLCMVLWRCLIYKSAQNNKTMSLHATIVVSALKKKVSQKSKGYRISHKNISAL